MDTAKKKATQNKDRPTVSLCVVQTLNPQRRDILPMRWRNAEVFNDPSKPLKESKYRNDRINQQRWPTRKCRPYWNAMCKETQQQPGGKMANRPKNMPQSGHLFSIASTIYHILSWQKLTDIHQPVKPKYCLTASAFVHHAFHSSSSPKPFTSQSPPPTASPLSLLSTPVCKRLLTDRHDAPSIVSVAEPLPQPID